MPENDIGGQSYNVPHGDLTLSLGRVLTPGVYFTRYRVADETFITNFLVIIAPNNRFTVEINALVTAVYVAQLGNTAVEKLFLRS